VKIAAYSAEEAPAAYYPFTANPRHSQSLSEPT